MAKITRREFFKRIALLGSFAAFIDISKVKDNLGDFSLEQIKNISEVKEIRWLDYGPYYISSGQSWDDEYYDVFLKDGTRYVFSDRQIRERYGDILDYFVKSKSGLLPPDYPAILND